MPRRAAWSCVAREGKCASRCSSVSDEDIGFDLRILWRRAGAEVFVWPVRIGLLRIEVVLQRRALAVPFESERAPWVVARDRSVAQRQEQIDEHEQKSETEQRSARGR